MYIIFKVHFIAYAITVVPFFSPLYSPPPCIPPPTSINHPPLVHVHGSYTCSLPSPFPILFLPSPGYFVPTIYASYSLYHFPHSPLATDNPLCDLHFCDSVPVLVVCLVCFCFVILGSVVDSCEFVAILLFIFLIFFCLDKSL